eukprot:CAMPEP_0168324840 /NCGR_PEP_ID=MMETSP0213-20121227/4329_1 /TAXON_ID=151035 /ORGANISM="Euplotes harpa, Strain FSP1.4" /LENGTH=112 /DNA_ID=CAMNT_0008327205 /DNA_START=14 /DNA_END=352 /DNA_ORIENTATION=+
MQEQKSYKAILTSKQTYENDDKQGKKKVRFQTLSDAELSNNDDTSSVNEPDRRKQSLLTEVRNAVDAKSQSINIQNDQVEFKENFHPVRPKSMIRIKRSGSKSLLIKTTAQK